MPRAVGGGPGVSFLHVVVRLGDGTAGEPARMTPVERVLRSVDRFQQEHRRAGFVVGVAKKFGDDRGGSLAALMAYYGFVALFPLLLLFTTILGFIGNARISDTVLGTTLSEIPAVGQQIGDNAAHPLTGSTVGLVVGIVGLLYGSLGVAQASQHAMAQVWNVPGVVRPGFVPRLGRSFVFFAMLAVALAGTAAVGALATAGGGGLAVRSLLVLGEIAVNVALYAAAFRVLTPRRVPFRPLVPGAVVGGVLYSVLLLVGTALVTHQLRHAQALYGQFGVTLGLIGWLYLVAQMTLYAAELNVVRHRGLWPRSILQPPLTDADRRVLKNIARQEERRPEERVGVGFEPNAPEGARADAAQPAAETVARHGTAGDDPTDTGSAGGGTAETRPGLGARGPTRPVVSRP